MVAEGEARDAQDTGQGGESLRLLHQVVTDLPTLDIPSVIREDKEGVGSDCIQGYVLPAHQEPFTHMQTQLQQGTVLLDKKH